jgi:cysteinyl-tRNA synthetase
MRLHDTLTNKEREFTQDGDHVNLYVCGITPYAPSHLGHAMTFVIFDVLRRYLEHKGFNVMHVQNFTDIDDKIIQHSKEQGLSPEELAEKFMSEYFREMDALNVKRAHVYPRATEEVPGMVSMIQKLEELGHAYAVGSDVYFRVRSKVDYGKLSHRSLDESIAGARVEVNDMKEDPMDFALWKAAKSGEPSWDSPWGKGRPGWHIECSVMSLKYLEGVIDIHGGGQDLMFPHHENEIAQSEAYTGEQPSVKFWMHSGLLQLDQGKMSKSIGNLVTIGKAMELYGGDVLRLFFLSSHYRSPLSYSTESLEGSKQALDRLVTALRPSVPIDLDTVIDTNSYMESFYVAMDDNMNTPKAIAALFDLTRTINRHKDKGHNVGDAQQTLRELAGVLGLVLEEPDSSSSSNITSFVELLIDVRLKLRKDKNYDLSDTIRQGLEGLGVIIEDTQDGTTWRLS